MEICPNLFDKEKIAQIKKFSGETKFYNRINLNKNSISPIVSLFDKFISECIIDDYTYKKILSNFNHLMFFSKFDKNLLGKLKKFMKIENFDENEVIYNDDPKLK